MNVPVRLVLLFCLSVSISVSPLLSSAQEAKSTEVIDDGNLEKEKLLRAGFKDPEVIDITDNLHNEFKKIRQKRRRIAKRKKQKPIPNIKFTHGFEITLVMLKDSDWTEKIITERMARTMEIYGQCGIMISKANLVMAHAPDEMGADLSLYQALKMNRKFPLKSNNVMYFQQTDDSGNLGYAVIKEEPAHGNIYNRSWISFEVASKKYENAKKKEGIDSWEEAHELAHILLNEDHPELETKPNLINGKLKKRADINKLGVELENNQCKKITSDPDEVGIVKQLKEPKTLR